jgi:hypothetical protein
VVGDARAWFSRSEWDVDRDAIASCDDGVSGCGRAAVVDRDFLVPGPRCGTGRPASAGTALVGSWCVENESAGLADTEPLRGCACGDEVVNDALLGSAEVLSESFAQAFVKDDRQGGGFPVAVE